MNDAWSWNYSAYDPHTERLVEALCTVGNGRFATRGSAPECAADDAHYPGTYLAGCYDRLTSTVAGRTVENEDLVNLPNWTLLRYRCLPEDGPPGEWLTPDSAELRRSTTHVDLRAGVLTRRLLYRDGAGRGLHVTHQRFVHMGIPWLAAQRSAFRAYGWNGRLEVESILDGTVTNAGVERYGDLDGQHLTEHRKGAEPGESPGSPAGPSNRRSTSLSPSAPPPTRYDLPSTFTPPELSFSGSFSRFRLATR